MTYLTALRWESRLVIAYILLLVGGLFVSAPLVILIGAALAVMCIMRIRPDYAHTTPLGSVVAVLPPLSIGLVLFGLIQSWMGRVGFGPLMRMSVTTALGTLVGMAATDLPIMVTPLLTLTALLSAVLREYAPANMYLAPVGVAALVLALSVA
jgi:hypothetical protein